MSHARTQIRDAVVAVLNGTLLPVKSQRVTPLRQSELPVLTVSINRDVRVESSYEEVLRKCYITVSIYAQSDVADDAIDDIAANIETLMFGTYSVENGLYLSDLLHNLELEATEIRQNQEGQTDISIARLTFAGDYVINRSNPHDVLGYYLDKQ